MAHIVAFIDELADLMVQFGGDVEGALCRLAQMARATGIHLIVATQRPSTDVLTGLIKANFPSRTSFAVASGTDSRVILDSVGAEHLLGQGDMLYVAADASTPVRIQGCFVSDEEIDRIVEHWRSWPTDGQSGRAPWEGLIDKMTFIEETDDLLERAIELAQKYDTLSTSLLQRRLRVGFPRAARLMETLYEMGLVEDAKNGGKTRKVYTDDTVDDPLAEFLEQTGEEYVNYRDKPNFNQDK
jgi:S-DNA-T family DNA segregation ATPase FtsK/SpoIIIE